MVLPFPGSCFAASSGCFCPWTKPCQHTLRCGVGGTSWPMDHPDQGVEPAGVKCGKLYRSGPSESSLLAPSPFKMEGRQMILIFPSTLWLKGWCWAGLALCFLADCSSKHSSNRDMERLFGDAGGGRGLWLLYKKKQRKMITHSWPKGQTEQRSPAPAQKWPFLHSSDLRALCCSIAWWLNQFQV